MWHQYEDHGFDLAAGECEPDCTLVESLFDDRPCEEDPACPAAWCPPATLAEADAPPPCTDPTTGEECRPLKRDLGVEIDASGVGRRLCLLRRATRTFDEAAGACSPPGDDGWYYLSSDENDWGCGALRFSSSYPDRIIEPGSRITIRCAATSCE